jgi:dipeptidase D
MAILSSTSIAHPAIEALFTIDEETGMTGAIGLQGGLLDAEIMLNLDTEDDEELTIGCAGGVDVTGTGTYETQAVDANAVAFRITVKGLTGGHSGMDIHKGRGNANKLMNRLLVNVANDFGAQIHSIDGGSLRNAIPRESNAIVVVSKEKENACKAYLTEMNATYQAEYHFTDPNLVVLCESTDLPTTVLNKDFQYKLIRVIYSLHAGIYRMDSNIAGLVQTSNNVSRILVQDGSYSIQNLTRSSNNTEKMDLADALKSSMELLGATVTYGSSYPGWNPNPEAKIVKLMVDLYSKINHGEKPAVNACHAGLECGILGTNYPAMEMISFGPTITGAHSPDERVNIKSVQKFWHYLVETLKEIPLK